MDRTASNTSFAIGNLAAWVAVVVWSILVFTSLWTQREQLDRTAESLARLDAITNLRKDMAIRKWASFVGGVYIKADNVGDLASLREQEHISARRSNGEDLRLVSVAPIHLLLAVQEISQKEYGIKERLTSLQLRNIENAPDDWEQKALESLKLGGEMVAEALPKKGGHGLTRVMIPMRMEEECLECHRDTLVPVGGLRGAAAITVDLNAYRNAQEPAWRSIQRWHAGIWLTGLTSIFFFWLFARRRAQERARQDEERRENETAFAAMAEGAIITDAQGSILWVNDAFCHIYGYQREEVIGETPRLLKSGRHDLTFYQTFWQQLKKTGHWRGELWNRRKTGEVFPEELSIQALRGPDGSIRRFISIFSDITERKKNEAELQEYREGLEALVRSRTEELTVARDQAEAANRAKSTFLANMSHELRTPLNAVIGFSQLMTRDIGLSAEQRRNLAIINSSGNHLLTLINDVLELSKIESGKSPLVPEEVDVEDLVRQAAEMLQVRAEQTGLRLALEIRDLPPWVRLDGVKLRQILLNLLSNAIKFTPSGEVRLRVVGAPLAPDRTSLDFSVTDTGVGIAPEDQQRVFEPFEQAANRCQQAGTGLGLTISRQYVQMMGGELKLESTPGVGSRFSFRIEAPLGEQPALAFRPAPVLSLGTKDRGCRVLVVDDMAEARLLVRSLLEPMGFQVAEAGDGVQALATVARFAPHLVLMDWRLPDMDGLAVTRGIRNQGDRPQPRIVMLTAHVQDDNRRLAAEAGADGFLAKPFQEAALFDMIERQLDLRFQRQAAAGSVANDDTGTVGLASLSVLTRTQLEDAALSLSAEDIRRALEVVALEQPELARQLQVLADELDYPALWQALGLTDKETAS